MTLKLIWQTVKELLVSSRQDAIFYSCLIGFIAIGLLFAVYCFIRVIREE